MKLSKTIGLLLSLLLLATSVFANPAGYLFVTFHGQETPMDEQIYFALSKDGRNWQALNDVKPVLVSQLGEKGVRDPYILRSHDNKKFFLIATDLSWALDRSVSRAIRAGSKSLVIWESPDLVHWSEPRLVKVAPDDAGCSWAPEAVYDVENGDYLVFWASTTGRDNFSKHRIWAARTKDFKTFGEPFIYIDKSNTVIDTTIIHDGRNYYRFTKDERIKAVSLETSPKLMGPWKDVPDFTLNNLRGYEGPACYIVEPASHGKPATWCLALDHYAARGAGYEPFVTDDLASGQFTPGEGFTFPFKFRHGTVLPLTADEYEAVLARWPVTPMVSLSPIDHPERSVRHSNFRLRFDENVNPAADGRWLLTSGLDGGSDTVSICSTNFPDHYVSVTDEGLLVQRGDGTPGFAAQASFVRESGLADAKGVSFHLTTSPDRYLKAGPSGMVIGPVSNSADRRAATFTIHE